MPLAPVVLANLGRLSKLPLELLFMILGYLDVPSAARFTQVNRQAQFLLWSDKDYQLLRYCLFRELSDKVYSQVPRPYSANRVPLKDVNYHTLAGAMSDLVCTRCRSRDQYTYRLDMRTGHNLCCLCPPTSSALIPILTNCVEMDRAEVKNTIPYRLPEGQLILSQPSNVEYLTRCFSRFREEGRELVLMHSSRDAWNYFRGQQKVLVCASRHMQ
ncbi:hypothetical protein F4859DRAFT_445595 [Xylaria cf. heliscus]|nr:hypothetical protein F4859DRAFT_445595 [Xylaria cf. heliscus]